MNYKPKDRVKILSDDTSHGSEIGSIVTLESKYESLRYDAWFIQETGSVAKEHEFELYERLAPKDSDEVPTAVTIHLHNGEKNEMLLTYKIETKYDIDDEDEPYALTFTVLEQTDKFRMTTEDMEADKPQPRFKASNNVEISSCDTVSMLCGTWDTGLYIAGASTDEDSMTTTEHFETKAEREDSITRMKQALYEWAKFMTEESCKPAPPEFELGRTMSVDQGKCKTRDGRNARIVCIDRMQESRSVNAKTPLIVLLEEKECWLDCPDCTVKDEIGWGYSVDGKRGSAENDLITLR